MTQHTALSGQAQGLSVELTPETADPNGELRLVALVPDCGRDIRGRRVAFRDADGAEIGRAVISVSELGSWRTDPLAIVAPALSGTHRMKAVLLAAAPGADGDPAEAAVLDFELPVAAHRVGAVIWDVPGAVEQGGEIRARIGLHCAAGCCAAGWHFRVDDAEGCLVAQGRTGPTPWPGTDGLFHADLTLPVPDAEGAAHWTVVATAAAGAAQPHAEGRATIRTRITAPAGCKVRVIATDARTGAPLARARVVAHPYRTLAGADGQAELALPPGDYTLFVSGGRHFPFKTPLSLRAGAEITVEAALQEDRELTQADIWA
ncbi:carboxypeptidase-like regulatory domain-containing protein [Rhodovulum strictum]|uniref:Carboxypeptidase regulatory-like domain-containing protein n=1 Tax=Rhodovulum strictum TaxID=58314 RepID=A0A844B6S2_9RHOB|nr:carboxypeptidase-like regulatory domain-containing protein [Rhodovulum strictum]MRH21350.1 hypothetical protein [Rhodovulum strictum]